MSDTILQRPTRLFVSHISEEAEVAALLKSMLEEDFLGLPRLFTSSDVISIGAGEDWLESIQSAIDGAAAVMVLCSRASVQRPWVQFEIGAAWIKGVTIIPICHSGLRLVDLPMPLSRLQGIELSTEKGLRQLHRAVADALQTPHVPLLGDLAARLQRIAAVEARFRRNPLQQFERYIDILIRPPGRLDRPVIPDDASIESNPDSLELFGLMAAGRHQWKDIVAAAREIADRRWLDQLQHCVHLASNDRTFRPLQAIYHSRNGSYQPQLSKMESLADGTTRFHVHLVETVVAPLFEVQNDFGLLATLLRLGLRFRYEVIERSQRLLRAVPQRRPGGAPLDVADLLAPLRLAVETIENDALSRGAENIDRAAMVELFDDAADQDAIGAVQDDWDAARSALFRDAPPLTFDEAVAVLQRMRDINCAFMELGTRRFHEMVRDRWRRQPARAPALATPA